MPTIGMHVGGSVATPPSARGVSPAARSGATTSVPAGSTPFWGVVGPHMARVGTNGTIAMSPGPRDREEVSTG